MAFGAEYHNYKELIPIPHVDFYVTFDEFMNYYAVNNDRYVFYSNGVSYSDTTYPFKARYIGFSRKKDLHRYRKFMKRRRRNKTEERIAKAKLDFLENIVMEDVKREKERAQECFDEAQDIVDNMINENKKRKSIIRRKPK